MNTKVAKKNNKGFTLIELIVVIAIIAVLAAILAPQYLRYVEKSRESADVQAAVEIINASKTAAAEEKVYNQIANQSGTGKTGINVTWTPATNKGDDSEKLTVGGQDITKTTKASDIDETTNPLAYELCQTLDLTDYKSKAYRDNPLNYNIKADDSKIVIAITEGTNAKKKWTDNESLSKYKPATAS